MKKIDFVADFGNKKKSVELGEPVGGGGYWDLMIDHRWYGSFVKYEGKWEARLHRPLEWITPDQLEQWCKMIDEAIK